MNRPRQLAWLSSLAALAAAACSSSPSSQLAGASGPTSAPAASSSSSSAPSSQTPNLTATTGGPGAGTCVPSAPATFADAVCVCTDLAEAGILRTHATAPAAASVGVNGRFAAATGSDIEGGLVPYAGLSAAGALHVRDAALTTGDVDGAGTLDVGGDLSVGGTLAFVGALDVGGTLRLAKAAALLPGAKTGGTAPYVAPAGPPCGCDPSSLLPVAQLVAQAAAANDNAALGLGTTGADLIGAGALSLPAGQYYFKDVTRVGAGKITVHGAVAIFIDGSIAEVGDDQIAIDPGASLDLYVSGVMATAGVVTLGDPAHPEAFRLFIGGSGAVMATAGAQGWNGLVYAPEARVSFAGVTAVRGSIFAKSLDWAGILDVTYDATAASSSSCAPADGGTPSSPSSPPDNGSAPSSPPASPH